MHMKSKESWFSSKNAKELIFKLTMWNIILLIQLIFLLLLLKYVVYNTNRLERRTNE